MQLEGAIFDMDGLMFDTERVWATLWQPALARFGLAVPPGLDDAARGTAGDTLLAVIRQYCGAGCDPLAIREELLRLGAEAFARGVPKKPGLDELLAWLHSRGVPMAVASSSPERTVLHNLETAGVRGYFAAVLAGDKVTRSKPAPDIFLAAAQALGAAPARCLVLEDSVNGVRAGAAGGFITVMVPDLVQPDAALAQVYTACLPSLGQVQAALQAGQLGGK